MGAKLRKYDNWIVGLLVAGVLLITALALHDMQHSQGVGLYLSIQAGSQNRMMFDVLTDIVACISLIMLIWFPCMLLRHRSVKAFFRLLVVFLAFMPSLSMAYLVHLTDTPVFALRLSLLEGRVLDAFFESAGQFMQSFEMILPFLCVLLAAVSIFETTCMKKWYVYLFCAMGVLLVGVLLFPGLEPLLCFVMFYFTLLICFDAWERLLSASKEFTRWSGILFGGLLLRGIYLLMELMSAYR